MARRFHPRSTPAENLRIILSFIPWRLLLLLPILVLLAIPAFLFGTHAGRNILPSVTNVFYNMSGPPPPPTPTPYPAFITRLPQPGSILYTIQEGDACDEILSYQMHTSDAGTIFTDIKPETIKALDASIGQDCHALQPGMVLTLSPHYPLVALGGLVTKIDASSPQQVLPTPVINVSRQQDLGTDCSNGCQLTVRIAPGVQVHLYVETTVPVKIGAWIWAKALLARKNIKNFANYPYADPAVPLNGMSMSACDIQINDTYDNNSPSCNEIQPNTINDDGGAWLFGVTGPGGLDHWKYNLKFPPGTRVLLWLSADNNGNLKLRRGNEVYHYDENSHIYVK